jgi:hypothetical protein
MVNMSEPPRHGSWARSRALPDDLVEMLERVRRVERAADSYRRRSAAARATAVLVESAARVGWSIPVMADLLGIQSGALRVRLYAIRRLRQRVEGLKVPPIPAPRQQVVVPLTSREWLRAGEACKVAAISPATLAQWRNEGLLPNTKKPNSRGFYYARQDLLDLVSGPQRGRAGIDRLAARRTLLERHDDKSLAPVAPNDVAQLVFGP